MKCKQVLQRLIATSGPRRVADDVAAHLEGCEQCQRWASRLHDIDTAIVQLPVPDSSRARSALVERFLTEPVASAGTGWSTSGLRFSWVHVAAAVAAVLVVAVLIRGVIPSRPRGGSSSAPDPLLAKVLERNVELAAADTIERRVEVLENLSIDLDEQALALARVAPADELNALADLYVSVVRGDKGLVARADEVPVGNRKKILESLATRLRTVGERSEKMAREVPPAATEPLQRIAAAARDAHGTLTRKVREEKLALEQLRNEKLAQEVPPRPGEGKS